MSKEKQTEKEELFSILSDTMNGANFDDLNDACYRIVDIANYHKQSQGEWIVYRHPLLGDREIWCSCCGSKDRKGPAWDISWGTYSFCPNCGAKMIGVRYVEERIEKEVITWKRIETYEHPKMKGGK